MKLTVKVLLEGREYRGAIVKDIPEMFRETFDSANVTDDPLFCVAGDQISEESFRVVMRVRKDAAEVMAKAIAEQLVIHMSKGDTFNGYSKNDKG